MSTTNQNVPVKTTEFKVEGHLPSQTPISVTLMGTTTKPEASFRSATALWDYVLLMARGNPMSVMIEQGAGFLQQLEFTIAKCPEPFKSC
eukprot:3940256-Rhodomonas_salina.1